MNTFANVLYFIFLIAVPVYSVFASYTDLRSKEVYTMPYEIFILFGTCLMWGRQDRLVPALVMLGFGAFTNLIHMWGSADGKMLIVSVLYVWLLFPVADLIPFWLWGVTVVSLVIVIVGLGAMIVNAIYDKAIHKDIPKGISVFVSEIAIAPGFLVVEVLAVILRVALL